MLKQLSIDTLGYPKRDPNTWEYIGWETSRYPYKLNNKDTYIIIIGPHQNKYAQHILDHIKKIKGKIIFKSERAINIHYNTGVRNQVVIFEKDGE